MILFCDLCATSWDTDDPNQDGPAVRTQRRVGAARETSGRLPTGLPELALPVLATRCSLREIHGLQQVPILPALRLDARTTQAEAAFRRLYDRDVIPRQRPPVS